MCPGAAPFCGTKTVAAPDGPVNGLPTSRAITAMHTNVLP